MLNKRAGAVSLAERGRMTLYRFLLLHEQEKNVTNITVIDHNKIISCFNGKEWSFYQPEFKKKEDIENLEVIDYNITKNISETKFIIVVDAKIKKNYFSIMLEMYETFLLEYPEDERRKYAEKKIELFGIIEKYSEDEYMEFCNSGWLKSIVKMYSKIAMKNVNFSNEQIQKVCDEIENTIYKI